MSTQFAGTGLHMGNLSLLSHAQTRSISAENPTGEPGGGGRATRMLGNHKHQDPKIGTGWKRSPCIDMAGGETRVIADITGPGVIQHIWMTVPPEYWRQLVLRFYWDDEEHPSIEVPIGDFFCSGWADYASVSSIPVVVAPRGGLNCYWEMPFRKAARITIENLYPVQVRGVFFQITYALTDVSDDAAYLHAQWRRSDPLPQLTPHTILDGVSGWGHYVGTYLAWEAHHPGWWGEGEIKFYIDDDDEYPTICGTGTEDYFGGAWAFEDPEGRYAAYSAPYIGMPYVHEPKGFYDNQQRFGLYRFHVPDPIRFEHSLKVDIQALGFRATVDGELRYRTLSDDIASTAWWYQREPHAGPYPSAMELDALDVS